MATGIKDKVAIIGMGCTKFGELWDKSYQDLIVEAFQEALEDAGIEKNQIQQAFLGTVFDEVFAGKSSLPLAETLKLPFIPVTRVENYCATGSEALRWATYAVASGACDIALALGVEKLKDVGFPGLPDFSFLLGTKNRVLQPNITAPGMFAQLAASYFTKYNIGSDRGKNALGLISAKSHYNATLNPKAHLRKEIDAETACKSPMVAWPLGLYDCCGVSDGAACAIICRADMAKDFKKDPVYIKSCQVAASSGEEKGYTEYDSTYIESANRAAIAAYKEAGIKNPREEISMFEVHDCFSITELVTYEDLLISPRGKAIYDVEDGFYNLDGKIPCQPSGGLKCFGHPIGASGLRMAYEMYKQLQGKAELPQRQLKGPRIGLTHNVGGFPAYCVCSISIFGNETG